MTRRKNSILLGFLIVFSAIFELKSQKKNLDIETLWSIPRVGLMGRSDNGQHLVYSVSIYNIDTGKATRKIYHYNLATKKKTELFENHKDIQFIDISGNFIVYKRKGEIGYISLGGDIANNMGTIDADAENIIFHKSSGQVLYSKDILVKPMHSSELYPKLTRGDVYVYDALNYRHWDQWEDGRYPHFHIKSLEAKQGKDIIEGEPFESPQMPFGGAEDACFDPQGQNIFYVCKKEFGTSYAQSTNTDIYQYHIATGRTTNLTSLMMGYDRNPSMSPLGNYLAFTSMKTPEFEADKDDIIIHNLNDGSKINLTKNWDGTVDQYVWSLDGTKIYFVAPTKGTKQLFEISNFTTSPTVKQLTKGEFDLNNILAPTSDGKIFCTKNDHNRAPEIVSIDLLNGAIASVTNETESYYGNINNCKSEARWIKTTDGKQMLTYVIYPPDFDPAKKYPTLLYCQGGPQSALTQFYSFRWNLQLMASKGYIVIAPNRRGMPGHGVEWNHAISGDWGGQPMRDYLSAVDEVSKENFVDKNRIAAVGASYGGYSVFMLAGIHQNRFKSFIAHCGLFDLKSWYGTTEELWFANYDLKSNYWAEKPSKSYQEHNPSNFVSKWNTPIMIYQGAKDYRVPIEQGLQAFQAAQLKGIKSRLIYLPTENHWVSSCHNGIIWQKEFFRWLEETLK